MLLSVKKSIRTVYACPLCETPFPHRKRIFSVFGVAWMSCVCNFNTSPILAADAHARTSTDSQLPIAFQPVNDCTADLLFCQRVRKFHVLLRYHNIESVTTVFHCV